mmetsp:Transcript_28016/g.70910  ORF Transcript_28016/g.70910 Transcript_28016/m.70910 type:complete len:260 (-) Transcript_28016:62-841(-)
MAESEPKSWGDGEKGGKPGGKKEKAEEWDLPGEITSRRVHKVTKVEVQQAKDEYVSMEWDDIFPKKPKERLRWLYKAFQAAKEGRGVKAGPLFDIIVHRKFLDGLKGQIATDTLNLIRGNLTIFSAKQQKRLTSDDFELFRKYAPIVLLDSDEDEADAPPLPPPPEVVIEPKDKKKKMAAEERRRREQEAREEEELAEQDEDPEAKRRRLASKGIERRIDPADGEAYTLDEFINEYGGSLDQPPAEWDNQRATSFIFKT